MPQPIMNLLELRPCLRNKTFEAPKLLGDDLKKYFGVFTYQVWQAHAAIRREPMTAKTLLICCIKNLMLFEEKSYCGECACSLGNPVALPNS